MAIWSRIANIFRGDRISREIEEELESHVRHAIAEGRDPAEARASLGPAARHRETSRDLRIVPWLDSLRADVVFGWRQVAKNRATSAAAILSLALAIGACTSAFRLIDAVLLRPLPVAHPERLYVVTRQGIGADGVARSHDGAAYPMFRQMRDAVETDAELIAVSYAARAEVSFGEGGVIERAYRQYVSGSMFSVFGLQPAIGRLFTAADDEKPQAHPYAALSHDYWTRRFGQDPGVVGRTFRIGDRLYEIVGVAEEKFTGTESGIVVDLFVPTMMHPAVERDDSTWLRTLVKLRRPTPPEPVQARLHAVAYAFELERAKRFTNFPPERLAQFLNQQVVLQPAPSGASSLREHNRLSLLALGVLVSLVLLIACANVANLMTARAAARSREMAMRVSIGAGRWRLIQLVLAESAWIAMLAAVIGGCFAWWSAPFVVSMLNPPDNPARLSLPADFRVLGFGAALAAGVTFLLGLAPALRASGVHPASILKGGEDPHARRHLMHSLVALQVAFCFIVLLVGSLFIATHQRLLHQPTGFSADRILVVSTVAAEPQTPAIWNQVSAHLLTVPGVETVALADQPLLDGSAWNGFISVGGREPTEDLAFFRSVSPGWLSAMKVPLLDGRDFTENDAYPHAAIVSRTFVNVYFGGENPVGKMFQRGSERFEVVGIADDARYRNLREPIPPVAYFPFHQQDQRGAWAPRSSGTFMVRTSAQNPMTLASAVRREVAQARPGFRATNIRTQQEINDAHTVRERLLAMLALFFAAVALLLAGVGVYGVLDYSVLQRRREIGIRMALGANATHVVRQVAADSIRMVITGVVAGLLIGIASERYIESLLFNVHATDLRLLAVPFLTLIAVASLAVAPAILRTVRIDPALSLRAD